MVVLFLFDMCVYRRRRHLAQSERAHSEPGDAVQSASKLSKTSDSFATHAKLRTRRVNIRQTQRSGDNSSVSSGRLVVVVEKAYRT